MHNAAMSAVQDRFQELLKAAEDLRYFDDGTGTVHEPILLALLQCLKRELLTRETNVVTVHPPAAVIGDVLGDLLSINVVIREAERRTPRQLQALVFLGNYAGNTAPLHTMVRLFWRYWRCLSGSDGGIGQPQRRVVLLRGSQDCRLMYSDGELFR